MVYEVNSNTQMLNTLQEENPLLYECTVIVAMNLTSSERTFYSPPLPIFLLGSQHNHPSGLSSLKCSEPIILGSYLLITKYHQVGVTAMLRLIQSNEWRSLTCPHIGTRTAPGCLKRAQSLSLHTFILTKALSFRKISATNPTSCTATTTMNLPSRLYRHQQPQPQEPCLSAISQQT